MRLTYLNSITPGSTIVAAYTKFLDDPTLNGQVVEANVDRITVIEKPPYIHGEASMRASAVYDPFFERVHGQTSGLPNVLGPKVPNSLINYQRSK